jgi:hypothetical protein
MLQDRVTSEENHERFIRRVLEAGEVWGLKSSAGWAVCESTEFEDRDVMPFWSDRAYAKRAAREEWALYEPTPIALSDFIDAWLRGMSEDGTLVGTNWDAGNCGLEVEPIELARRLTDAEEQGQPSN